MLNLFKREQKTTKEHLEFLFDNNLINVENSSLLYRKFPPLRPDPDVVQGVYLGVMIGDALGNKVEGELPEKKHLKYSTVNRYFPSAHITDDTQLTMRAVNAILDRKVFDPDEIAYRMYEKRIRGIGHATKESVKSYKALFKKYGKRAWIYSAVESAGNGALMRLSAVLAPHFIGLSDPLVGNGVLLTRITYNDRFALSSAGAFSVMLYELIMSPKVPEREWWVEKYVEIARGLEGDETVYSSRFEVLNHRGPAWKFVEKTIGYAEKKGMSLLEFSKTVGSGAYLLETVPFVLYTMMEYSRKPYECLGRAVTDSKNSDTIGAIVGYLLGAMYGTKAFPPHLLEPAARGELENKWEVKVLENFIRK